MISNTVLRVAAAVVALQLGGCAPGGPQVEKAAQVPPSQSPAPSTGGTYRPPSQDAGVRSQSMVPGRAGRVFIFAAVDKDCQPLAAPEVTVTRAPAKGEVSLRPGQQTKLAASAGGTCLGVSAVGTGVYYTARPGTVGADSFTVSARLATGETMTRDFSVKIAD